MGNKTESEQDQPPATEVNQSESSGTLPETETQTTETKTPSLNRLWSIVPAIVILLSALIYMYYDRNFIQCDGNEGVQCRKLEGVLISRVDDPMDISNANQRISATNSELANTKNQLGNLTNQTIETKNSITTAAKEIANAKKQEKPDKAAIEQLTNSKAGLDELSQAQTSQMESLTNKKDADEVKLSGIQNRLSKRYANRMLWVFLTGVSLILSIAAIIIALFAICNSLKDAGKTYKFKSYSVAVGLIALTAGIAGSFAWLAYSKKEKYMSVILPMYQQSIMLEGGSLIDSINFINVLAFAVIVFLVVASGSLLYKVQATAEDQSLTTSQKEIAYSTSRNYLQIILYVGAAMLVAGVIRTAVLQDWHLSFVSDAQSNAYVTSLEIFFESSLKVQAGFYSILLAVIYFPAAYWIKQNVANLKLPPEQTSEKGLSFTWTDFLPKLISVFSPILAAPLSGFIGNFFGGGS
jgi:hypothetical protein